MSWNTTHTHTHIIVIVDFSYNYKRHLELTSLIGLKLLCNCLLTCIGPHQNAGYNNWGQFVQMIGVQKLWWQCSTVFGGKEKQLLIPSLKDTSTGYQILHFKNRGPKGGNLKLSSSLNFYELWFYMSSNFPSPFY